MPHFKQWRGLASLDGNNLLAFYSVHLTSVLTRPGERETAVLHLWFLSHNAGDILTIRRIGKSHHTNTVINMPDITTKSTKGNNNWALIRIIEILWKEISNSGQQFNQYENKQSPLTWNHSMQTNMKTNNHLSPETIQCRPWWKQTITSHLKPFNADHDENKQSPLTWNHSMQTMT